MKGPKGILARALTDALADFFVVDPVTMEARLIREAGIKLHNTRLKTQVMKQSPSVTITIDGVVEYVAFQWHWGHSDKLEGGSDWVKDAILTISGLNFAAKFAKEDSGGSTMELAQATTKQSKENKPGNPETEEEEARGIKQYVRDQVQRIIDTLTLHVTDFLLKVELPRGSSIEFGGKDLELLSLGRTEGSPLRQELSIASLFSNVLTESACYPVLEPIHYKATAIKTFGKRFVSGIDKGLQVTGKSGDAGIVIHTGGSQMEVLNELIGLVLTPSSAPSGFESMSDTEDQSEIHFISEVSEVESDVEDSAGASSFFKLPLSAVSLVLPNSTKLSLSDLTLKYQMDGTMLKVEGHAGFLVNDFPFLRLGETSLWCADLVASEFRIFDGAANNEQNVDAMVAFLHARKQEIESVRKGVDEALGIVKGLGESADGGLALLSRKPSSVQENHPASSTTPPWSFRIEGEFGCFMEQGEVELMLRDIQANVADDISVVIGEVNRAIVPGTLRLTQPMKSTKFKFNGSSLELTAGRLFIAMDEYQAKPMPVIEESKSSPNVSSAKSKECMKSAGDATRVALPFGVLASVETLVVHKPNGKPDGLSEFIMLGGIELKLTPEASLGEEISSHCRIDLSLSEFNHDMIRIQKPVLSTVVDLSDVDILNYFHFAAANIAVASGYTILDWKKLARLLHREPEKLKPQETDEPIKLPRAHVDPLRVVIIVKSNIVGLRETVLRIGAFNGRESTTVNDMIRFYSERVLTKVPGMVIQTEVLGTSVADSVVAHYGGAATAGTLSNIAGSTLGGASVGGLLSVAAFDGVRRVIKAGKASRGAEANDRGHLSDVAMGLKYAAVKATEKGAAKRGKKEGQGDVIDWAIGATDDVAKYTNENKSRLGGAGAGAVGFAWGMALGGPVGAVAGAVISSAATSKTIDTLSGAFAKKKIPNSPDKEQSEQSTREKVEDSSDTRGALHGILLKRRDFFKWDWRAHYFVLEDNELKYYVVSKEQRVESRGKHEAELRVYIEDAGGPRKILKLVNMFAKVEDGLTRPEEDLFVFAIYSNEQQDPLWFLGAATEEIRQNWVESVNLACRKVGQLGHRLDS